MTTNNAPKKAERRTLHSVIRSSFLSSSLVPLFTIELLLLALYFGTSWLAAKHNKEALLGQVKLSLGHVVASESRNVDAQLQEISRSATMLQSEQERFFEQDGRGGVAGGLPGPEPVFETAENGVLYKANKTGCSLYFAAAHPRTEAALQKARGTEVFDPLLDSLVNGNASITQAYFNSYDGMNRLCPFIDDVVAQFPPDLVMPEFNFYYLADTAHNPSRGVSWTGAYLDPAGQGWMVSAIVPIYSGDFLEGVTGLDVTIEQLVSNILNLELPWKGSALLLDKEGVVLAMQESAEEILSLRELKGHDYEEKIGQVIEKPKEFTLVKSPDTEIATVFQKVMESERPDMRITLRGREYQLLHSTIATTGWRLVVLVDHEDVFAPVYVAYDTERTVGYVVIGLILMFYVAFLVYLIRKAERLASAVTKPVVDLANATVKVGRTTRPVEIPLVGIREIDRLSRSFVEMTRELGHRTSELVESKTREKLREKEALIAYNTGLYESASAYLHNLGNALVGVDGELHIMRHALEALERYEHAFEQIKEAHRSSHPDPDREDRTETLLAHLKSHLLDRLVPGLRKAVDGLGSIRDTMVQSIRHQQASFREEYRKREKPVQTIDVGELLEEVAKDASELLNKHQIALDLEATPGVTITNQRHQLFHGVMNLVKNAVESIAASENRAHGRIAVTAVCADDHPAGAIIRVRDNGLGFGPETKVNMFKNGFTTKAGGHGLGLHSLAVFLNENNGSIRASSDGPQRGAEFVVEVGNE